jgi:hypothetical protein
MVEVVHVADDDHLQIHISISIIGTYTAVWSRAVLGVDGFILGNLQLIGTIDCADVVGIISAYGFDWAR